MGYEDVSDDLHIYVYINVYVSDDLHIYVYINVYAFILYVTYICL